MKEFFTRFQQVFFLCLIFSCSSIPTEAPEWIYNKEMVYPSFSYISGLGDGETKEIAKNNAVAEISRYLQTSVDSVIQTELNTEKSEEGYRSSQKISRNVTVSSKTTLSGLSYTQSYFNKSEKRWYCLAYISREKAWNLYQPEIEQSKMSFYAFYNKIPKDNLIKAYQWYQKVQDAADDFLEKLVFASVIDSDKERVFYISDRLKISELASEKALVKDKISVFIEVRNDDSDLIQAELTKILSDLNFQVKNSKNLAKYIASANLDFKEQETVDDGDLIFNESPVFSLAIYDSSDSFYKYVATIEKKIISFSQKDARKKAVKAICEIIKKELKEDFTVKMAD